MAIDKAIDSSLLDGALSASADAIRAKTGDVEPIPFDAATGFASAIAAIAAGGGALGIKTGTVTISDNYLTINVEHGCGKLPFAVTLYPKENFEIFHVGRLLGGMWQTNSFCVLFTSKDKEIVSSTMRPYYVPGEAPPENSMSVNETVIHINPPVAWNFGTYEWIAIYEV